MHRLAPALLALPVLALTACGGPSGPSAAQVSASAEAAHQTQVAQAWSAAVTRRKAEVQQLTNAVASGFSSFGISRADVVKSNQVGWATSACYVNYGFSGVPNGELSTMPEHVDAALKAAGWKQEPGGTLVSDAGVKLDWRTWQVTVSAGPTDPDEAKKLGYPSFSIAVSAKSNDHGCAL